MTDRPEDGAEPIDVEAVADDPPAGENAGTEEGKAEVRRRRRGRLLALLWLLPVALILAVGYLVAAQPERVAAFLAGKQPDMATAADMKRLADRVAAVEAGAAGRAEVDALSSAATASREASEAAVGAVAAMRDAQDAFGQRLDALEERVAALEGAEPAVDPAIVAEISGLKEGLAALEARPADAGAAAAVAGPALASLKAAVAVLESRLEGLEASNRAGGTAGTAATEARVAADRALAELAALRDAVAALARSDDEGGAVKLAVARLRFAVDAGAPFEEELAALQAAGGPGFGAWTAHAEQGLPTAAALARRFKELARARTVRTDGATGTPWLDDVIGRLSDVVSVRRVSKDLAGDDANAALGRAEAHIEDGDLAGAVAELGGDLPPPFEGWRRAARNRLAADAELEAFTAKDGR